MKLSPAAKLSLIAELLGGKETHICSECGEEHVVEKPRLITPEQARELLEAKE